MEITCAFENLPPAPPGSRLYPYQNLVKEIVDSGEDKNILVVSPTGSGKTYAIEHIAKRSRELGMLCIIAEPLIALAMQIYDRLGGGADTALLTGPLKKGFDIGSAKVVVGTYEAIARLSHRPEFDASDVVVIDELHYLGSDDRCNVLCEILGKCARKKIVGLSGTIVNYLQVASFVGQINEFETVVTGATRRPIATVYWYYDTSSQRFSRLVQDRSGGRTVPAGGRQQDWEGYGIRDGKQGVIAMTRALSAHDCFPACVIKFSIAGINWWMECLGGFDFTTKSEKSQITVEFGRMRASLNEEDRPLVDLLLPALLRGIAMHTSALVVPFLELICDLAERRCLYLILSTSTLAAGINLPIKTVVLTEDKIVNHGARGAGFEEISSNLTNQLIGRAGRPGLETEAHAVFVGAGAGGYATAQRLAFKRAEPVLVRSRVTASDVIQALRHGRVLPLDRLCFEDPSMRKEATDIGSLLRVIDSDKQYMLAAKYASELEGALGAMLRYVPVAHDRDLYLHVAPFCVSENPVAEGKTTSRVRLTTAKKAKLKLPIEDVAAIFELQRMARYLVDHDWCEADRRKIDAAYEYMERKRVFERSPIFDEYEGVLSDLRKSGIVEAEVDVLTPLGSAVAEIRSIENPHEYFEHLTRHALSAEEQICLAAAYLAGPGKATAPAGSVPLPPDMERSLRAWDANLAAGLMAVEYYKGRSLHDVCSESSALTPGALCKLIVRCKDLLVETQAALVVAGMDASPLQGSVDGLHRGLPFMLSSSR